MKLLPLLLLLSSCAAVQNSWEDAKLKVEQGEVKAVFAKKTVTGVEFFGIFGVGFWLASPETSTTEQTK